MTDLRTKNDYPKAASITEYLSGYSTKLAKAVSLVPAENLEKVFGCLKRARENKVRIYVAGNGGSCAIAAHLCCDWMKGTHRPHGPNLKVHSLTENTALLTALSNDLSYEEGIAEQVRMLGEAGDVLLLISSSGNSPNIVAAARAAKQKQMTVVGFTGFKGGKLGELADFHLHVPVDNYGIVEDTHQMLMHVLAQYLYIELSRRDEKRAAPSRAEISV